MGSFIKGVPRDQLVLFPNSLSDMIPSDSYVRVIDAFINKLDLVELGFTSYRPKQKGTNFYDPRDLLKLYIYGYKNKIRSSRKLARECHINIEVMWLINGITPDFRTISDFRKNNHSSLKNVFKKLIILCNDLDLIGDTFSQDGTKIMAVNSKENNFTLNKVDDLLIRINKSIDDYLDMMNTIDKEEQSIDSLNIKKDILDKLDDKFKKKVKLEQTKDFLEKNNLSQISLTDSDSKLMKNNSSFNVCYNNQVLLDSNNHLVVNFDASSNPADTGSMHDLLLDTKKFLDIKSNIISNITDKGYFDRFDMMLCFENGIIPNVTLNKKQSFFEIEFDYIESTINNIKNDNKHLKECLHSGIIPNAYKDVLSNPIIKDKFIYETNDEIEYNINNIDDNTKRDLAMNNNCFIKNPERNIVYCPEGFTLRQKSKTNSSIKYCNKEACKNCKNPCTSSKFKEVILSKRQIISSSTDNDSIRELKKNYNQRAKRKKIKVVSYHFTPNKELLSKRMSISEHSHGSMKRYDDAYYFLLKGRDKVNGELALYYTSYDLRRLTNIYDSEYLVMYLNGEISKDILKEHKRTASNNAYFHIFSNFFHFFSFFHLFNT